MITDEMVEAACKAVNPVSHVIGMHPMRRGLEAADRAAWQPIETAPKDGTFVLLGRFVEHCEFGHAGMMAIDRYSRPKDNRGWIGWGKFSHLWPPTHWRYLPDAP